MQDAPAGRGDLRDVGALERKAVAGEPVDSLDGLVVSVGPALLLMQRLAVMIEAHADHEPRPMRLAQAEKPRFDARALHRLHGIGEDEREMAAGESVAEHGENVGVHERLAAGEADLPRGQRLALDLIEEGRNLAAVDISEPVVLRARFDIAIAAFDVAQAAGVDPQHAQSLKPNLRAPLTGSGPVRVAELLFPRLEERGLGHDLPCKRLLISRSHDQPARRKANPITLS